MFNYFYQTITAYFYQENNNVVQYKGCDFKEIKYSNYYYNVFTNPLSIIWERGVQTKESMLKKLFSMPGIKHMFGKYVVKHSDEVFKLNVVLNNASDYYDSDSVKLLVGGVYLKDGYILTNYKDIRFGEWSGMAFDEKGDLILVSDRGAYLKSSIVDENGVQNFINTTIGKISVDDNTKTTKDFEELAIFNGSCFISDEFLYQILRYENCDFGRAPITIKTPDWKSELSYNKGIEAFDINLEGKFLAIAEYDKNKKDTSIHKAYYWSLESNYTQINSLKEFTYLSKEGYGVSGLKFLKNGDLLVLERYYEKKFGSVAENYEIDIKYVKKQEIESAIEVENAQVKGKSIIHIDNESISGKYGYADNFESIAVKEGNNSTSIYILTDDNRAPFERSMLLEFEIINNNFDY